MGEDGDIQGAEGSGSGGIGGIGGREGVGARDGGGKWGDGEVKEGEMDREGFDAEKYVREVLGREGLEGVLRIEGALVGGGFFLDLLYLLIVPHYSCLSCLCSISLSPLIHAPLSPRPKPTTASGFKDWSRTPPRTPLSS